LLESQKHFDSERYPSSSEIDKPPLSTSSESRVSVDDSDNVGSSESDTVYILAFVANVLPILAIVLTTAILYRGQEIFLPITTALILSVIFAPVVSFLENYLGRFLSTAVAVFIVIGGIISITYFFAVELTAVADRVSSYSDNIGNKLSALQKSSPPWLRHLKFALSDIQGRLQSSTHVSSPKVIQAVSAPPSMVESLRFGLPILDSLVEVLLITVLLFFLLYSRRDLRDRFVRIVARAQITIAPLAIEAAGHIVGRYLLLFSLTNLGFGLACGLTFWLLGLPSAPLWGALALLLRFIPYVGAMVSAFLPAIVAFAVFPGWSKSLEVIGGFVLIDQIAAQFIEPFVIGRGIDVSPVALLIAAVYWSWLWGMPGLLLATPLTACLKIAGDYIPAVGFLSILLSADRKLEDYHDFFDCFLSKIRLGRARWRRAFAIETA
jgi:predicted PurR-regulated permease PerM